jgi:hypothetical protein
MAWPLPRLFWRWENVDSDGGQRYLRVEFTALLLLLLLLGVLDGVVGKVEATVDESLTPLALWSRLTMN